MGEDPETGSGVRYLLLEFRDFPIAERNLVSTGRPRA